MMLLFEWLDATGARFWTVAWSFFVVMLASALAASKSNGADKTRHSFWRTLLARPDVFAASVLLTLAAFRWPIWFAPSDINPDEDQMLAAAITLRRFPIFWKYVDGGTAGPLNNYLLVGASWLGVPLNYLGARIIATLLQAFSLLSVWGLLRRFAPERVARLALIPGLCFWAFTSFHDFAQYSSEQLAIALVAGAMLMGAHATCERASYRYRNNAAVACGFLAGMIPFAKLQLVPLAVYVIAWVAIAAWWQEGRFTRAVVRQWFALFTGGIAFPAVVAVCLSIYGLWGQFNLTYIQANIGYVEDGNLSFGQQPAKLLAFLFGTPGTGMIIGGSITVALLFTWPALTSPLRGMRAWSIATWLGTAVAFFCVIAPGRELAHYLQILIVPCSVLAGFHLASACKNHPTAFLTSNWPAQYVVGALFMAITVAPPVFFRATQKHFYTGRLTEHRSRLISPSGAFLNEHMKEGDTLTVWGWLPRLHVETQMPQGTRDTISARQIFDNPLRYIFRGLYLRDMQRRKPTWFVDSVGPTSFGFHDRSINGYESFPALASVITSDYVFVAEVEGVRIFQLRK